MAGDTRQDFEKIRDRAHALAARLGQTTLDPVLRALVDEIQFTRSHLTEAAPLLQEMATMVGQFGYALTDMQAKINRLETDRAVDAVVTDIQQKRQA